MVCLGVIVMRMLFFVLGEFGYWEWELLWLGGGFGLVDVFDVGL